MGDGLLFFLGIVFFFILWVVSGGPTRPISFAGPFITPITNEGQTQTGYGPKLGGTISAGGSSVSIGPSNGSTTGIPNTSAYTGKVFLNHFVNGAGSPDPSQEYLSLQVAAAATQPINISEWRVVSTVTGASAVIPQGVPFLRLGVVTTQSIVLQAGNIATITTGFSPVNISYEENTCTNYLPNQQSYAGCFAAHSQDPQFLTGTWRIFLNRGAKLWQNKGETIKLLDASGKVVDSFSY